MTLVMEACVFLFLSLGLSFSNGSALMKCRLLVGCARAAPREQIKWLTRGGLEGNKGSEESRGRATGTGHKGWEVLGVHSECQASV